MTEQEILKGNKIIAEFEGISYWVNYDEDYSRLMSVVEKITKFKFEDGENAYFRTFGMINIETGMFMSRINRCQVFEAETLKTAIWLSVVDWCRQD